MRPRKMMRVNSLESNYKAFMIEIEKRKYVSPIAEKFIVEEEEQLLEGSLPIDEGGGYAESHPIVGSITFDEDEATTNTSNAASFWDE
jgi:hypothetical protein